MQKAACLHSQWVYTLPVRLRNHAPPGCCHSHEAAAAPHTSAGIYTPDTHEHVCLCCAVCAVALQAQHPRHPPHTRLAAPHADTEHPTTTAGIPAALTAAPSYECLQFTTAQHTPASTGARVRAAAAHGAAAHTSFTVLAAVAGTGNLSLTRTQHHTPRGVSNACIMAPHAHASNASKPWQVKACAGRGGPSNTATAVRTPRQVGHQPSVSLHTG
jgi:hypothetical protein